MRPTYDQAIAALRDLVTADNAHDYAEAMKEAVTLLNAYDAAVAGEGEAA